MWSNWPLEILSFLCMRICLLYIKQKHMFSYIHIKHWDLIMFSILLTKIILHCLNISEIDHYCTLTNCISSFTYCLFTHLHFADHTVEAMAFPVIMYRCYSWTIKMAEHWRIHAFQLWYWRRLLRVPWTARRSKVNPKGNQHWIFTGRTVTKAPILWPPDAKRLFIGKDSHAGKDWRQEKKRAAEDEMICWHRQVNEHEFEQTQGDSEEQGSLACWSPWVTKNQSWFSNWTTTTRRRSIGKGI